MANYNDERKNKSNFNTENSRSSVGGLRFAHRGKPQQQLYRPGSGPLKKSNGPEDRDIVISHIRDMDDRPSRSFNYNKKCRAKDENIYSDNLSEIDADMNRQKKPGRALYVAKQKNFSTDTINKCHLENRRNIQGDNSMYNSRMDNNNSSKYTDSKNKRFSSRHHSNTPNAYNHNRDIRHSSEPRSFAHNDRFHEIKSFDGLEKNSDHNLKSKQHHKGNGSNYINIENKSRDKTRTLMNLPPRLQKKFLMENGYPLDSLSPEKLNLYATKKNHQNFDNNTKPVVTASSNMNGIDGVNSNTRDPSGWCQTLPLARGRGRGIVRKSNKLPPSIESIKIDKRVPHVEYTANISTSDSRTFGRNELHKLSQCEDTGSLNSIDSEIYYNIAYSNESMQHRSDPAEDLDAIGKLADVHISPLNKKMDWSEEVELQEQQDKGRISPFVENSPTHHKSGRGRRRSWSRSRSIRDRSTSSGSRQTLVGSDYIKSVYPDNSTFGTEPDHTVDITGIEGCSESIDMERRNQDRNTTERKNISLAPGLIILPQKPSSTWQRTLYDPKNPNTPIVVNAQVSDNRIVDSSNSEANKNFHNSLTLGPENTRPTWYDVKNKSSKLTCIVKFVEKSDLDLHCMLKKGTVLNEWNKVQQIRSDLEKCLYNLLVTDIKFCQTENVEHHFWKIVFYNIIEVLKKTMVHDDKNKTMHQQTLLTVIDDATKYYEKLLCDLEEAYKYKLDDILSSHMLPPKGLGFVGLALVASQKIFLFLGDLARYREQACETNNYSKSKQYYMKAQQVNPKNGRPYNQLAILSIYARRKLDAVYYYMRSLMSSNPFYSAKDSLLSLFDENRKKYETLDRKRKEELEKRKLANVDPEEDEDRVRREIWIHPGRKPDAEKTEEEKMLEGNEELVDMSSIELNKRFITSYLHVHGKLITKIGMESFVGVCRQMLLEFHLLLKRSPLPVNSHRLLQLVALNIFAIDSTFSETNRRGEVQERALGVALEMASQMLDRCVTLISAQVSSPRLFVPPDVQVMLPALKVFCDWLLCHINIWNPPPFSRDLRIASTVDMWTKLADLIGLLEQLDHKHALLTSEVKEGHSIVRLQEDVTLCGFMPLMYAAPEDVYAPDTIDPEAAQVALRLHKIQFFGSEYLCGVDPPILKPVSRGRKVFKYVSNLRDLEEREVEKPIKVVFDEPEEKKPVKIEYDFENDPTITEETKRLLIRKRELEREKMLREQREKRYQEILDSANEILELEIRPKFLVPDTNCFIDYMQDMQNIAACSFFTLMVPLIVLNELEGLSHGNVHNNREEVAIKATIALKLLREKHPHIKFLTTRGNILIKPAFTAEETKKTNDIHNNDDRILASALSLCKRDVTIETEATGSKPKITRIKREVVLLTMDRNLRVKALAADMPVRPLPEFVQWLFSD